MGFGVFTFLALTTSMDQLDPCWDEVMDVLTCGQLYEGGWSGNPTLDQPIYSDFRNVVYIGWSILIWMCLVCIIESIRRNKWIEKKKEKTKCTK